MLKQVVCIAVALFALTSTSAIYAQSDSGDVRRLAENDSTWNSATSTGVCSETSTTTSCSDDTNTIIGTALPGENCCDRQYLACFTFHCLCGVDLFFCGPNNRGGCTSSCYCHKCPV